MDIQKVPIELLHFDPSNARKHDEKNISSIKASLAKFGQQTPIVVDQDNIVLAGNGRLEAAKALGWSEIEVVRSDLKGPEAIAYAIADNRTSDLGDWDNETLGAHLQGLREDGWELEELGFELDDLDDLEIHPPTGVNPDEHEYTKKIEAPIYEITGEKPKHSDLYDYEKKDKLLKAIGEANLDVEDRLFLIEAAHRHTVFNYQNIAEFYAHAPRHVQELMEDSALVIIDFDKAIESGHVSMSNDLAEAYRHDNE